MDAPRVRFELSATSEEDERLVAELYKVARVVSHESAGTIVSIEAEIPRRWLGRFVLDRVPA